MEGQIQAQQEEDLLVQFNMPKHNQYHLRQQLSLRQPEQHHSNHHQPNQSTRLVYRIFENYSSLMRNIATMKAFLESYGKTLECLGGIENEKVMGEQSAPLIIKKIVRVRQGEQKEEILAIVNKLKLMILKATYKKTTRLDHLNSTYLNQLKDILMIQDRNTENIAINNIIYPHIHHHQIILTALGIIKQFFDVIRLQKIKEYKHCPLQFLNSLTDYRAKVCFFINLYTESLLFVHRQYIGNDEALMYCPVVEDEGVLKISQVYLGLLNYENPNWMKFQLYIEVFHSQTSNNIPIFYSKMINEKQSLNLNKHKDLRQNIREEMENLETLINKIRLIRKYVFVKLIYNYLAKIYNKSKGESIEINLHDKFKVIISPKNNFEYQEHSNNIKFPTYHPELIINLMTFLSNDSNISKSRSTVQRSVNKIMECMVFKLISELNGSRVSWPLHSGSVGDYCYEYNSQRIIGRTEIKSLYKNY